MRCVIHEWSEWGPPYEGQSPLGRLNTYQQRECKKCHARQRRRIGGRGHAKAAVPVDNRDRLLEASGASVPEVEPPRRRRERGSDIL